MLFAGPPQDGNQSSGETPEGEAGRGETEETSQVKGEGIGEIDIFNPFTRIMTEDCVVG